MTHATPGPTRRRRRIGSAFFAATICVALILVSGITQNNCAVRSVSRQDFERRLSSALDQGVAWVDYHADTVLAQSNAALYFMLADMNRRARDPRLERALARFLKSPGNSLWRRLADPEAHGQAPSRAEIDHLQDYQRWILFALDPTQAPLTESDRRAMFAPDAHRWGSLTHQLFAVHIYRMYRGGSAEIDHLIDHLCERIAAEAIWDIRVTDLYLQRTAFLLMAGRPDLVKRRWVERVLAWQQPDGGWVSSWHGWGPGLFRFTWQAQSPNPHTTVQGLWTLHLIRHRYPDWIVREFPGQ